MRPNSLKYDCLQMLQYFLSLRTVHIAHPAKRVLPSKIAELDPITDTSLLFPYFFGAGLPLAAGGRHCRTGRRTIRSECVTPPPPTPASGWGQTYALHKFPALRTARDGSMFSPCRLIPLFPSGFRDDEFESRRDSFIRWKANELSANTFIHTQTNKSKKPHER